MDVARLLLGIYTSTVSSMLFLAVTLLLFSMMFAPDMTFLYSSYIAIMASVSALVFIIYKVLPRDRITHNLKIQPPDKAKYKRILILSLIISPIVGYMVYSIIGNLTIATAASGILLVFPGLVARKAEKRVRNIDNFFPTFIRSYGITFTTIPHQAKALASILRSDYGALTKPLKRLYARLVNGVDPKVSWLYFIGETWSELVRKSINILYDAIDAGGDIGKTGVVLSDVASRIINIRKQRDQISGSFEITIYVMHTLMVAITMFIITLIEVFQGFVSGIGVTQGKFTLPVTTMPITPIKIVTTILVLVVSVCNAFAIKVSQGGMYETVWIYISLLIMLSAGIMFISELISKVIFQTIGGAPTFPIPGV